MGTWKAHIEDMKQKYIGMLVIYEGQTHRVIDIDYNGALMIDRPTEHNKDTAVGFEHITYKRSEQTNGNHIHVELSIVGNHEAIDAYLDKNGVWSYKTTADTPNMRMSQEQAKRRERIIDAFHELY